MELGRVPIVEYVDSVEGVVSQYGAVLDGTRQFLLVERDDLLADALVIRLLLKRSCGDRRRPSHHKTLQ